MTKANKEKILYGIIAVLTIFVIFFAALPYHHMHMEGKQNHLVSLKDTMQEDLRDNLEYRCCLKKPCALCLLEDGRCDCLKDLVDGKAPCGECIGEILDGNGNPYLVEYYAKAISEEVGEEHLDTLKKIIKDKYNTSIEKQDS